MPPSKESSSQESPHTSSLILLPPHQKMIALEQKKVKKITYLIAKTKMEVSIKPADTDGAYCWSFKAFELKTSVQRDTIFSWLPRSYQTSIHGQQTTLPATPHFKQTMLILLPAMGRTDHFGLLQQPAWNSWGGQANNSSAIVADQVPHASWCAGVVHPTPATWQRCSRSLDNICSGPIDELPKPAHYIAMHLLHRDVDHLLQMSQCLQQEVVRTNNGLDILICRHPGKCMPVCHRGQWWAGQ